MPPAFRIVKSRPTFDAEGFLRSAGVGKTIAVYRPTEIIFSQGDAADSVMYLQAGAVKLSVVSRCGKEAVIGMLEPGAFFGERALAGRPLRQEAADDSAAPGRARLL